MSDGISRRNWLKATGLSFGALMGSSLLGGCAGGSSGGGRTIAAGGAGGAGNLRKGSVRVAHLTDFHIQPEDHAGQGVTSCLHHVQSLKRRPDLILNTGDCVMNTLHTNRERTQVQWDLWNRTLKNENSLPIQHCIGNHDIWGWAKESGTTGKEPGWGKQWAMDALGLVKPYHAFDCGGWRVIMLDSCQPSEGVWYAKLDDAQFAWLESELSATTKPVLIGSHVPLVSPAVQLDPGKIGGTPDAPAYAVRRSHVDMKRIGALFGKHPNVKLCVSGHLHEIDRAEYRGVTYITNPAVCGGWWRGKHFDLFGPAYTLLDLHADGTFDVNYVDYGWVQQPDAKPSTQPAMT